MADTTEKAVSKYLIEIRFKPMGRFFDEKGKIADRILSDNKLFSRWNISQNRIDFFSEENLSVRAFFSYMNLGLASLYPNDSKFFIENVNNYVKSVWDFFEGYQILRIGIRSMFYTEADDFEDIFSAYKSHFLKLNDENIEELGGDLIDVGFPLNFRDKENYFNLMTGPMKKDQVIQFFGESELQSVEFPSVGIFVDVDFYRKDIQAKMKQNSLLELVTEGTKKAEKINDLIVRWINNSR